MASLQQIFGWFSRGLFPTQDQYKQTFSSFWHRSERLPITQILGLNNALDDKATKSDLQNISSGLRNMGEVANLATLNAITNPQDGDAYKVISEKDPNGNSYIYRYTIRKDENGNIISQGWVNTKLIAFDSVPSISTHKNKFNPETLIYDKGANSDGTIINAVGWAISYIEVNQNTQYSFIHSDLDYRKNSVGSLIFCDVQKNILSFVDMSTLPDSKDGRGKTLTTPPNCTYIVKNLIVFNHNYVKDFQIEEGDTCTDYEPYYSYISEISTRSISGTEANLNQGKNKYNPNALILNAGVNSDGSIGAFQGWAMVYIPVTPNTQYSFIHDNGKYKAGEVGRLVFCGKPQTNHLSSIDMSTLPNSQDGKGKTITIPDGCYFILKNIVVLTNDYRATFQIEEGDTCTFYQPYGLYVTAINGLPIDSGIVDKDLTVETGKNKYNSELLLIGGITHLGDINTGGVYAQWRYAKIDVEVGKSYSFKHNDKEYNNYNVGALCLCKIDGAIIEAVDMSTLPDSKDGKGKIVTIATDCAYIMKNLKVVLNSGVTYDYLDDFQIEEGDTCTFYQPYYRSISKIKGVDLKATISNYSKNGNQTIQSDKIQIPLNIVWLGDSITSTAVQWMYVTEVLKRIEFTSSTNLAQSGAFWSHTSETKYNVSGSFPAADNVIYNEINKLIISVNNGTTPSPDVIVIAAGTNDFSRTLGNPKTVFNSKTFNPAVNEVLDIASAVRYNCELIWKSFPNCQIILATPLQRGIEDNTKIFEIGNTIRECAKYLSLKVIDQALESGIYGMFDIDEHKYMYDNLHLTALGAEKVGKFFTKGLVNKIEL